MNSRLSDTEEHVSDLGDRIQNSLNQNSKKRNRFIKIENNLEGLKY